MTNEKFMEIKNRMMQLVEQDEFLEAAQKANSTEDAQQLLASYGIELTIEEVSAFAQIGQEAIQHMKEIDELDEEMLDTVAGGRFKPLKFLGGCGLTAVGVAFMTIGGIVCFAPGGQGAGAAGMAIGGAYFISGLYTIEGSF